MVVVYTPSKSTRVASKLYTGNSVLKILKVTANETTTNLINNTKKLIVTVSL